MSLYWIGFLLGVQLGAFATVTAYRAGRLYRTHRETVRDLAAELRAELTDPNRCLLCPRPHDGWPSDEPERMLCQDCWEAECDKSWWDNLTGPGPMVVMDLDDDDSH